MIVFFLKLLFHDLSVAFYFFSFPSHHCFQIQITFIAFLDFQFVSFLSKAQAAFVQKCDHNATWEAIAINAGKSDFPVGYPTAALTFSRHGNMEGIVARFKS